MVVLIITSLSEKGDEAIRHVAQMKVKRLAKFRIAATEPHSVLRITYGKRIHRFLKADTSLAQFTISRGLQMGIEAMLEKGAEEKRDFTQEVDLYGE